MSFFILVGVMFLSGCGLKQDPEKRYPISLEIWGLFDDSDTFDEAFDAYRKANQNVKEIKYKKLTPDTYKKELLEALASGKGPDIFLIQNTWLPSFYDKVVPVIPDILNEQKFKLDFVDVAVSDFMNQRKIFAVPLSVDTLGLYYNKDLFNQAGITTEPKNWDEFIGYVKKLTKTNSSGQIIQSGAAIGTVGNINRATDILNLLMLQGGTAMVDTEKGSATFDQLVKNGEESAFPGENALIFYTQFAKENSSFYSWNKDMHNSVDAFSEGTLAMMLNYSWKISEIKNKAPKLNFAVAPVPQIKEDKPINYPNYWGYAVAKNKVSTFISSSTGQQATIPDEVRIAETWKLLKFLTVKPEVNMAQPITPAYDAALEYAKKTNKPAARKDIIEMQKVDPEIGVFALQNLMAKSWLQMNPEAVEAIFADMIEKVNKGMATPREALKSGAQQVTQSMER